MLLTPAEHEQQLREEISAAVGAAQMLAALLPALAFAEIANGVPHDYRVDIKAQVRELVTITQGYSEKFRRALG